MADGTRPKNRTGRAMLWIVLGFLLFVAAGVTHVASRLDVLVMSLSDDADTKNALSTMYWMAERFASVSYGATLFASAVLAPIGALARMLSRARVRAGFADPLDRVRAFVAGRARLSALLAAAPALVWTGWLVYMFSAHAFISWDTVLAAVALPAAITLLAQMVIARRGLRGLLAPTLSEEEASGDVRADGLSFTAVAVTTETIGAVAGLATLSTVMVSLSLAMPTSALVRSPAFGAAMLGYLALATGGALLFRRASRISVGLDGIHVSGSARERFIPFREIDGARVKRNTIELFRGERVVLRLQLHGEDAIRRAPLTARINAAIELAVAQRHEPAVSFVASASTDALDRAAGGVSSYREAAPTREKLWQVLESPAVDAAGRKAAATALSRHGTIPELARLRVAADQCAEPSVRARIEELLEVEEESAPAAALKVRRADA